MRWIGLPLLLVVCCVVPAWGASPDDCLACHDDPLYRVDFPASVHGPNGCTSCHRALLNLDNHPAEDDGALDIDCGRCHRQIADEVAGSIHQAAEVGCRDCHAELHRRQPWGGEKQKAVETCLRCHDQSDYTTSVHGRSVADGNDDSAACHDCHGLHRVRQATGFGPERAQVFNTEVCIPCHADREKMARNNVAPGVVETFFASHHGKSYRLGNTRHEAGCADCHTAHRILPRSDPASSLNGGNLVTTCGRCHKGATPLFTQFYAHGDPHDRAHYPLLYWTFVAMTGLLVTVFVLFWIHSLLWMFRGFVENREKLAEPPPAIPEAHKPYRRFRRLYIFLHLIVIVSFLGLSVTGLPLKFSDQNWAQRMMSFFGGVEYAGSLHRACAVLTFYYFIAVVLLSLNHLFVKNGLKGWLARLLGPDSLMPNLKDWQDLKGMIGWFLFRGPKPRFERWTYWEKFDFLAVFWGMFAIGGSGLLLWFPEFFGGFLPGWVFNVATIIHSDEALLATGFIFTVHFFNTHGRPEKFPMDFVIFNGQISKQELIEERGAQWQRYEEAGTTAQFEAKKPSGVLYDFLFKGFGFLALFTGLALAFLMLAAFIGA